MDKMDTNGNGVIDYTEFIAGCMKSKIYLKEEHLKSAFSYFDKVTYIIFVSTSLGSKWYHNKRRIKADFER